MDKNIEDIKHIRSMMERSTKFLSLSGFSGIGAGIIAFIGAFVAKLILVKRLGITGDRLYDLAIVAIAVIILASMCGLYFSMRKARKNNSKLWMPVTIQILKDFLVPLITGGILCIAMLINNNTEFIPAVMLVFYGLSLIAAGARTYRDIKVLGACEIILGILSAFFTHKGLFFWTLGFGALHVIYGLVLYLKYDRFSTKRTE